MHFGKTLFFIQILLSKLLYCISFLHFMHTFFNYIQSQKRNFSHTSYTHSCLGSQFLWFNNYTTVDNNSVQFKEFSSHNINFINQLLISEGEFINTRIRSKENFKLPIIYITNLRKFYTQSLENKINTYRKQSGGLYT